jgi:hypothetical protein
MTYEDALNRIPSQRERIVNLLKDAGEEGVLNTQLNNICLRYGARISELVSMGYVIDIKREGKGLYRYFLKKVPSEIQYHKRAEDEILYIIDADYDGMIETLELKKLLLEKDFHIIRKPNWFKQRMI